MSKLVDTMRRVLRGEGPRMGFGASPSTKQRSMILLAELPSTDPVLASRAVEQSVDGLFFPLPSGDDFEGIRQVSQLVGALPWGVQLAAADRHLLSSLFEMGCDFLVLSSGSIPLSLLREEKPGKVLQIDGSLSDGLLRALDQLPIDLVLMECGGGDSVTISDLMNCWRVAMLVRKPLALIASPHLDPADLPLVRETGVEVLVVALDGTDSSIEKLGAFRQAIETLPHRRSSRQQVDATLPLGGLAPPRQSEDSE